MDDNGKSDPDYWTKRAEHYNSARMKGVKRTSDVDWNAMDTVMAKYGKMRVKPDPCDKGDNLSSGAEKVKDPNKAFKMKKGDYSKVGKKISDSKEKMGGGLFHEGVWYPNKEVRDDAIAEQEDAEGYEDIDDDDDDYL